VFSGPEKSVNLIYSIPTTYSIKGIKGVDRESNTLPDALPDALPDTLPDTLPDALPDALPGALPGTRSHRGSGALDYLGI